MTKTEIDGTTANMILMTCCDTRYATVAETIDHKCSTAEAETPKQTGTVGRGAATHEIVEGHAKCGASFRRGRLGNNRVQITGGEVTCRSCE